MTSRWRLTALCVLWACLAHAPSARAQAVEFGAHTTYLDLGALEQSAWGVGGRVGFDALPGITLEAEVNVFPAEDALTGTIVQGVGGMKLGGRGRTYGLFAKVRPGFLRFERDFIQPGSVCPAVFPTPPACLATRTNLALDFGSVVELYPSSRLTLRLDLGTTYVWYGSRGDTGNRRYGNFQLGIGAGVRF
jgi:hypothetical protein